MTSPLHIGTAGWAIPRALSERFPAEGSGLQRYAARFDATEINSSFYRPHRAQTYERWATTTPSGFRFAVKAPRAITHEARLVDCQARLRVFVSEIASLGPSLGPTLVQLPPDLAFEGDVAARFFSGLRSAFSGLVALEPRHATWFGDDADALLRAHRVARVAADPARHPRAAIPGGWFGLAYWRLHGSPRMYYSPYEVAALDALARNLVTKDAEETWCIFDNTASGAAAADALRLRDRLSRSTEA